MAHDKLVAFLEQEAKILKNRLAGLKSPDILSGVTTGDGDRSRIEQMEREAEARLAEVEGHLRDLRSARDAA
jgi:hypothetical protein